MGAGKRHTTQYDGVVYREREKNGKADRYFILRHRLNGTQYEEGVGWASANWTAKRCYELLVTLRNNQRLGTGPQTLKEMRDQEETRRTEQARQSQLDELHTISLGAWLTEHYVPSRRGRRSDQTVRNDMGRAAIIASMPIGSLPLQSVTADDIQRMLDDLKAQGRADATRYQYMALIRHAYNEAMRRRINDEIVYTGSNPVDDVELRCAPNERIRFLSRGEAALLLSRMMERGLVDLHDAAALSLHTGLRLGELQRLQWQDVDLHHAMLHVRAASVNKPGGSVPLNSAAMAVLTRRRATMAHMLVFPPVLKGRKRENISQMFKAVCDDLGLNDGVTEASQRVVFHTMRHTFASWLAIAGVDLYRIKTLMRHKTIEMTQRYAKLMPDSTRASVHLLAPTAGGSGI